MPRDLHYDSVQNPSLLSFQSSTTSASTVPTTTSWSTAQGIGSFAGRALLTLGEATLRRGEMVIIQTRLRALKSQFPHKDSDISPDLRVAYGDVLELSRYASSSFISNRRCIFSLGVAVATSHKFARKRYEWCCFKFTVVISNTSWNIYPTRSGRQWK
jgi:hypothetical protein